MTGRGEGSKATSGTFQYFPSLKGAAVTVGEGECKKPDYGKFRIPSSKELNRERAICIFC